MSIGKQGIGIPLSQVVQVGGSASSAGGAAADRGAATDAATAARRSANDAALSAEQAKTSAANTQQSQILAETSAQQAAQAAQAAEMYANETAVDAANAAASAADAAQYGFPDAPDDGKTYVRRNRQWVELDVPPVYALRTVPATADRFYIVSRNPDGTAVSTRIERNVGGPANASNVGGQWPEWRTTGQARIASFEANPASPVIDFSLDNGAHDTVAGTGSGGKYFGSYHGLGTSGALISETLLLDGVPFDPAVAATGNVLEIRNETNAVEGSNFYRRDLSTYFSAAGNIRFLIHSASQSGMGIVYTGMLIAQGLYAEGDVLQSDGTTWTAVPTLGMRAYQGEVLPSTGVRGFRFRDTTNGRLVTVLCGGALSLASAARGEFVRSLDVFRSKAYFCNFRNTDGLAGFEWTITPSVVTGVQPFNKPNLLVNGDFGAGNFTGWTKVFGTNDPTLVNGMMRQVRETGNVRMRQTAPIAAATTDLMAYELDSVLSGGSGCRARVALTTSLSNVDARVDREITTNHYISLFSAGATSLYVGDSMNPGAQPDTLDTDNYALYRLS